MDTDHCLVNITDPLTQQADQITHLRGSCVTDCVGDIDGGGPCINGRFHDLAKKVMFGAGGIFGRKLHIIAVTNGSFHASDRSLDYLFRRHSQLEFPMNSAGCQEDVDT